MYVHISYTLLYRQHQYNAESKKNTFLILEKLGMIIKYQIQNHVGKFKVKFKKE